LRSRRSASFANPKRFNARSRGRPGANDGSKLIILRHDLIVCGAGFGGERIIQTLDQFRKERK
jgi:hypothetical protein